MPTRSKSHWAISKKPSTITSITNNASQNNRSRRAWKTTIITATILTLGLTLYENPTPRFIPNANQGMPATPFVTSDIITEKTYSFDQLRDKVTVINFWASWCKACFDEHKNLIELNRRLVHNKDFVQLGVIYQDSEKNARQFIKNMGGGYPQLLDAKGEISKSYSVLGVPETLIIDRDGIVRCKHFGPLTDTAIDKIADRWALPLLQRKKLTSCA